MSLVFFGLFLLFLLLFSLTVKSSPVFYFGDIPIPIVYPDWFSFLYFLVSLIFLWFSFEYYSFFPKLNIPFWILIYQGPSWVFNNSKVSFELKKISSLAFLAFTTLGFAPLFLVPEIPNSIFFVLFAIAVIFLLLTTIETKRFLRHHHIPNEALAMPITTKPKTAKAKTKRRRRKRRTHK
jgi:hypothetical protein